jgi:chemotaxis protein MotB
MENDFLHHTASPQGKKTETAEPVKSESPVFDSDWQQSSQPVFVVEESFYRSRTPPRAVHWSIAWSDLMMTMFILFLALFAHQRTHLDILAHGKPNRIADETVPVQQEDAPSSLIFHPISQEVTLKPPDQMQESPLPLREQVGADILIRHKPVTDKSKIEPTPAEASVKQQPLPPSPPQTQTEQVPPQQQPADLPTEKKEEGEELITQMYDLSKVTLSKEKLERFASVELIPDKTMRIILAGDLLFPSGQADLTPNAINSLKKLSGIIKKTPYMINIIGHTDSQPVHTPQFPSNWELSSARASRVARFLIEDTQLPATQFSVSGYSSLRPVQPNTSDENRKLNRRVEIILSKERPQAEPATPATIQ